MRAGADIRDHERACSQFREVVDAVGDCWGSPSPCSEWDARGILEHVIGFHEVLVLRPLAITVQRPKDDIAARWSVTQDAALAAISRHVSARLNLDRILPALTTDVVVHTWDLGRATGQDIALDTDLVERSLAAVMRAGDAIGDSGMYSRPVAVSSDAPALDRLLGLLGRDPAWQHPD
jgi:uncharacterized protein (TIGR03086 family)